MSELQSVARLKIHEGKLDEFKRLSAKCAERRVTLKCYHLVGPFNHFDAIIHS